jgi:ubiquinone biosynthesis protein
MVSGFAHLRSIKRFAVICFILFKELVILWPYRMAFASGAEREKTISKYLRPARSRPTTPEIAKKTLEKLGPTYIKFGQFMSIRPDLIPAEFCNEFKKLQDNVPPFPFAQVKRELREELKSDYTRIFSEFDEVPLAAASVSQVHRARLMTGEEVVVKVQRPGIREAMVSDILIMLFFAKLLVRLVPSLKKHEPKVLIREFSRWTDRELYFRQEGKNALHFTYNFRDYPCVQFPKIFHVYTTRKVLVMEYIRGVNILHVPEGGIDRKAVASLIADSMLKQIFIDGFFHGDPHAGNILLTDRSSVAYLDFGIVGHLSEELRAWIFDILYGMSRGDTTRVINSFLELCSVREDEVDLAGYRRQMNEVLSELQVYEMAGIPFSQMMKNFLYTSLEYGIRIPHEFVLVTKALTTFEGTCLSLDPEIKIVEQLRGFVARHVAKMPGPDEVLDQLKAAPFELERMKRLVLKHGARIVKFLEDPVIRFGGEGAGGAKGERDRTGENIAFGFIIASLIVFAGLAEHESIFGKWLASLVHMPGLPLLPLVSLAVAALLGMRMIAGNRGRKGTRRPY